jgi:NDP-sugar pyrophosphorylase family protein
MIDTGVQVAGVETEGEWSDLIYPWDILSVSGSALKHTQPETAGTLAANVSLRGKVNIGEGCVINSFSQISGPVVFGHGCTLGPHAFISGPVSIGANTVIEQFACISNSVIGSDVLIGSGAIIQDSVIDDGAVIGARFTSVNGEADIRVGSEYHHPKIGAMIGEGCRLGAGVITKAGTILGNFCQVGDLKVLSGNIEDRSMVV